MICPNCHKECEDLYTHSSDCDLCVNNLDIVHCGCYYDCNSDQNVHMYKPPVIKADKLLIHRCVYCKDGSKEENMFTLNGRWDNNPDLDSHNIVGSTVVKDGEEFEIIFDDSSPKLGAPYCFLLIAKLRK